MPEGYYPNSACDIILLILFLVLVIGISGGLTIGFMIWTFQMGTSPFVLIWSVVLVVFLVLMFVGIFFGGQAKLLYEKKVIREKVRQLQ